MTKHEMYGMKLSSLVSELREISVEKLNKQLTGIAADTIEQLVEERNALAKCFRITRTDDPFTNQAVFKIDYCDIIDKTADELVYVIAHGLVRAISGEVSE